ncbi:MAG: hypothetical protein ACJ739_06160 [Acidimicrobiales bacterium]
MLETTTSDRLDDDELARIHGLVSAARDRLAAVEEGAGRLHALLEWILAAVPPLAAVSDRVVVAWSAELERLSGIPATAALGRPVRNLLPGTHGLVDAVVRVERAGGDLVVRELSVEPPITPPAGGFSAGPAPAQGDGRSASG